MPSKKFRIVFYWPGRTRELALQVLEQPDSWQRGEYRLLGNQGSKIQSAYTPQFYCEGRDITVYVRGEWHSDDKNRNGTGVDSGVDPRYLLNIALALTRVAGGEAEIRRE